MTAHDEPAKDEPFERAKLPMILAAVGVAAGLAIAGSVERTAGGAIVLAGWVLGIASLHRLGRAGSMSREVSTGPVGPAPVAADPTAPGEDTPGD